MGGDGIKYNCTFTLGHAFKNPYAYNLIKRDIKYILNPPSQKESWYIEGKPDVKGTDAVLDYETTSLNPRKGFIVCYSLGEVKKNPLTWAEHTFIAERKLKNLKKALLKQVKEGRRVWVHNAIFEWMWTYHHLGIDVPFSDTIVLLGLQKPNYPTYSLKHYGIYRGYGDYGVDVTQDLTQLNKDELLNYCSTDVSVTRDIVTKKNYSKWINTPIEVLEQDLVRVLARMKYNGIKFDPKLIDKLGEKKLKTAGSIERGLKLVYPDLNIRSNQQISKIIYKDLKLKHRNKPSVAEGVLEDLSDTPFVQNVIEYRKNINYTSKFCTPYLERTLDSPEHLIHPSPLLHGARTGRLSFIDPAIQQIGGRIAYEMEDCCISRFDGGRLLAWDWKTVEIIWAAFLNRDKNMIKALMTGDVHTKTAGQIYGVKRQDVTKEQRFTAKTCNFLLIYLGSKYRLADQLGVDVDEAGEIFRDWHKLYPNVLSWARATTRRLIKTRKLRTVFGRVMKYPNMAKFDMVDGWDSRKGKGVIKSAVNFPISSPAADTTYIALVLLSDFLLTNNMKSVIIRTTHDSCHMDCPEGEVKKVSLFLDKLPELVVKDIHTRFKVKFDLPLALEVK